MSFFTDVRDTVTAPLRAAGDFFDDLLGGKNFADSLGQLGARELAAAQGPAALISDKTKLNVVFDKASPYTLGITGRLASGNEIVMDANREGHISGKDFTTWQVGQAENAAIAGLAATGNVGAAVAVAGATNQYDHSKNLTQLASTGLSLGISGGFGDIAPDGFSDIFGTAKSIFDQAQNNQEDTAQNVYNRVAKNLPPTTRGSPLTTVGPMGSSNNSDITIAVSIGLGIAILYLWRRHVA